MTELSNAELFALASGPRFAALTQLDANIGDLLAFDPLLQRDPRLLVPVDVNAFVVDERNGEATIRLPFRTATEPVPDVADPGTPRAVGVHLLWTVPAALGRGSVLADPAAPDDPTRSTLELPTFPDRWVVLRIAVPVDAAEANVRGWVLCADEGTVTALADYPAPNRAVRVVPALDPDVLNAHIGGPGWADCYDAAFGRLAFHDPLDDLATVAPDGVEGDSLSYVVCGWWDHVEHDPLDGVGSINDYHAVLDRLGWDDPDHPESTSKTGKRLDATRTKRRQFGLSEGVRYSTTPESKVVGDGGSQVRYRPARSGFVTGRFADAALEVAILERPPTNLTLLHGRLHGVPLRSGVAPDDRPPVERVGLALGPTAPSVSALLASGAMTDAPTAADQEQAERLLTAFHSGLLSRIDDADVWPEIEHYEHLQGFGSLPGGVEAVDRLREQVSRPNDPGSGSRIGRRENTHFETLAVSETLLWSAKKYASISSSARATTKLVRQVPESRRRVEQGVPDEARGPRFVERSVTRPAIPFTFPVAPVLALTGAGRRLRAAERDEADGVLRVRTADQVEPGPDAIASARKLLSTIGSGAVPDEVVLLARETIIADPFLADWRAARASGDADFVAATRGRNRSEAALRFAYYAGESKLLEEATGVRIDTATDRQRATEGFLRHVTIEGVWAHPEGVTIWGQPWRPQFCEWSLDLELAGLPELLANTAPGATNGWAVGEHDLIRRDAFGVGATVVTITGRSPLHTGAARMLEDAVRRWLEEERVRDSKQQGVASRATEDAMATLRDHLRAVDLLSVTLDGVREVLLGLRYDRGLRHDNADVAVDGTARAVAEALPRLVAAGRLRLTSARLVDSWGRLLTLPTESARVVARALDAVTPATIAIPPRLTTPSRVHLRLVDHAAVGPTAATAFVDQVDVTLQMNPVAGFVLPDHIDEALEMFASDGTPLGQLSHDAFSDGVVWEGAPGRTDIGPAAGPLDDADLAHRRLGWIAAGVVTADAIVRQGAPGRPEVESSLSAMLRAIDTTLWSVDPFGSLGTEHIAGLVGRPLAVVTAELTLDVQRDLDALVYGPGMSRGAREQAYAELATVPFAVRLGTVVRSDDGLVGFFVDDDYSVFHVIDRNVSLNARESGRCRGALASGPSPATRSLIDHGFIDSSGYVTVRVGQVRRITMLVHPGAKVHLSSGIAPRSSVALMRDWVQPGLSVLAPSVRVGPLLIDSDKVRLPKVSSFPADQLFTRRESPGAWRDDPILAATQTAFLPDQASTFQEGWIRVNPNPSAPQDGQ